MAKIRSRIPQIFAGAGANPQRTAQTTTEPQSHREKNDNEKAGAKSIKGEQSPHGLKGSGKTRQVEANRKPET
jgi:hypothetical protein